MRIENESSTYEENIIKRQRIAVIAIFVLIVLSILISIKVYEVVKYGLLGACVPGLYLSISSIKNRLSIVRLRAQKERSKGKRAIVMGIIVFIAVIGNIIIAFTLPLSEIFFPS